MNAHDVLDFYKTMSDVGVEVWIDGGWGVDALLGKQTRQHKDLDIAIEEKHVALLRDVLLSAWIQRSQTGGCASVEFRIGR
jgi:lincosamide nucleotidyltransferase A/C/D/E